MPTHLTQWAAPLDVDSMPLHAASSLIMLDFRALALVALPCLIVAEFTAALPMAFVQLPATSAVCVAKDMELKVESSVLVAVLLLLTCASLFVTDVHVVALVASANSRTDTFVSAKSLALQLEALVPTAAALVVNSALLAAAMVDVALA